MFSENGYVKSQAGTLSLRLGTFPIPVELLGVALLDSPPCVEQWLLKKPEVKFTADKVATEAGTTVSSLLRRLMCF